MQKKLPYLYRVHILKGAQIYSNLIRPKKRSFTRQDKQMLCKEFEEYPHSMKETLNKENKKQRELKCNNKLCKITSLLS
jgi:hypothetical protein